MPARRRPGEGGSILSASGRTRCGERLLMELSQKRLAKSLRLRAVEQFLVKCAVRTDPRAERNVDVDVSDPRFCRGSCQLPSLFMRDATSVSYSCAVVIEALAH